MARIARYCDRGCEEYPVNGEVFHFGFCKFTTKPRLRAVTDRIPTVHGRCAICLDNLYTRKADGSERPCLCSW